MNRTHYLIVVFNLLFCLLMAGRLDAQPPAVGQLLGVQGTVEREAARQKPEMVRSFDQVKEGDLLTLRDKSSATVVLYESGARFALTSGSTVKIGRIQVQSIAGPAPRSLPAVSKRLLKRVNTPMNLGPSHIATVNPSDNSLPSETSQEEPTLKSPSIPKGADVVMPEIVALRHPLPAGAIRNPPIVLRWEEKYKNMEEKSLTKYILIEDLATGQMIFEQPLSITTLEYEVPAGKLESGRWYKWTIIAASKSVEAKEVDAHHARWWSLYILTKEEGAEVEAIEKELERIDDRTIKDPTVKLLKAKAYENFGLFADALISYEVAAGLMPSDASIQTAISRLRYKTGQEK